MIEYVFLVILAVKSGGEINAASVTQMPDRNTCSVILKSIKDKAAELGVRPHQQMAACTAVPALAK